MLSSFLVLIVVLKFSDFSRGLKRAACLPKTNTFPDFEGLLLKKVERQKLLHAKRKQVCKLVCLNHIYTVVKTDLS